MFRAIYTTHRDTDILTKKLRLVFNYLFKAIYTTHRDTDILTKKLRLVFNYLFKAIYTTHRDTDILTKKLRLVFNYLFKAIYLQGSAMAAISGTSISCQETRSLTNLRHRGEHTLDGISRTLLFPSEPFVIGKI